MTRPKDRPEPRGKERVICVACGQGNTVEKAIWKRQGRTKCKGCDRWIPYQDLNTEG